MATITADSIEIRDPADLPEAFARAYEIFDSRRPRPVHIGIPIDVLDLSGSAWERLPARGSRPLADAAVVERAIELLAAPSTRCSCSAAAPWPREPRPPRSPSASARRSA